ncbi:protoporphyrinogen/coproporphyrinogen oxidase [Actinophytocola gossypii]|uniref:FAD-dependent oxidoreductase n=1 Tax=Actinophytocola gossypii TaxID=2812003 RepID=A0ABT2JDN9_9PSEU|nr:FAD-dependent oxidoreductase [Actinophytocola gossypii]MCT2585550.1 FAD-dependent oxidoreductase [Actinophytocola gossypii]
MSTDLDVAVVGAGIAGLTAAHELTRAGLAVRVFEARDRVGGRMASHRRAGYTMDEGAEQLPAYGYRATWELVRRTGLTDDEVPRIGAPLAMWRDGAAHPGVSDPRALLTGAGLSPAARLDLARFLASAARHRHRFDPDRPERTPLGTATVAELARRYHPDLHDYLFQPVVGSFFGWHPERSAAAPFVSLLLAVGPPSTWRTYRDGMDTLARRLADDLDVATATVVSEVDTAGDIAVLTTDRGPVTARVALLCVPAPVAARLHRDPAEPVREFLDACTFTPTLKVSCLLNRPLAPPSPRPLYTLLTPRTEEPVLAGIIVDHVKHPWRAPAGRGLLTLMTTPTAIPALLDVPDHEAAATLLTPAARHVPGLDTAVTATVVHRFRHGLPEATPAALRLRAGFAARPPGPVDYAGDWEYLRPSSEGAVRSAARAASRALAHLRATTRTREPV